MNVSSGKALSERAIIVDQNIKATVVAKGVADALTQAISKDEVLGSLVTDVKQTATTESKGLDDLVKAIFEGITGIYGSDSSDSHLLLLCVLLRPNWCRSHGFRRRGWGP